MNHFISLAPDLTQMITAIVNSDQLHARWLNTLSYLENCGARKIAACEHPILVKEEMLKHAAEEFRHAHFLKRQIEKVSPSPLPSYSKKELLGGIASLNYLNALDIKTCRYLSEVLPINKIRETAYLLVTYAIELRANELYAIYDEQLRKLHSKVGVRSIIAEEKEHLNEMIEGLHLLPFGMTYAQKVCTIEKELCTNWIKAVGSVFGSSAA